MKLSTFLISVLPAALLSPEVHAQTPEQSRIETIIVTGERILPEKIPMKATFTQSTIQPEKILNASPGPITTVQTLLNTEPSIYATTGGANGMETDIKFRSFSDGEFGETVAGVPLNDLFNGGVTYQADNRNNVLLVTRDLDSVQLYRGVNNPAVNTYNSLGGTINFVPRQPKDELGGDVGVDGGSFDTLNYHATFDTGEWNGIRQTISFERDYSSSWLRNVPDWNDNIYYAGNADLGSHTQLFGYFIYNKNAGDAPQYIPVNLIKSQGWSYQWPADIYRSVNNDANNMGIIGFKSQLADFITVEDEAYIGDNDYRRTSFSNPAYPGPYFLDDQGSGFSFWGWAGYDGFTLFPYTAPQAYGNSTAGCAPDCAYAGTDYHFYGYNAALYGDRAQIAVDLPYNKITAGGDFNVGELHSREYWYGAFNMPMTVGYNDAWDEHDTRQFWSIYAQDDIHFWDDRVHITPGVKYINSVASDNDALGIFYFPPGSIHGDAHFLSPTLGASVIPVDNFTVYAAYGRNVKFPDITALYNELGFGGAVPPVTAQPEYVQDLEAGARYRWEGLLAEVDFYQEYFTHILYTAPVPGGFGSSEQLNGGDERFRGVELQLTEDLGEVWVGNWKGYLNASYNEAICTTPTNPLSFGTADIGGKCNVGESLANIPNYLVNAGLTWDWSGWHVDLEGHYVGKQLLQDFNTSFPVLPGVLNPGQPTRVPDYFLVNLGIVKVVPVSNLGPASALRFALHVDNLFNVHYYSDAQTNSNANTAGEDVYALAGEPRGVFGSIGIYF